MIFIEEETKKVTLQRLQWDQRGVETHTGGKKLDERRRNQGRILKYEKGLKFA